MRGSQTAQVKFRLLPDLLERLTRASEERGCSLSEEIRQRVQYSFEAHATPQTRGWEHKMIAVANGRLQEEWWANRLGEEGWELFQSRRDGPNIATLSFKRPRR